MFDKLVSFLTNPSRPSRVRPLRLLALFLAALLPVILLAFYTYFETSRALTEALLFRARSTTAVPMAAALSERLDRLVNIGESFASHGQVRQAVLENKWDEAVDILKTFHAVTDEPFIDRVFVADANGVLWAGFPETGTENRNFSERDWYQGLLGSGGAYISEVYKRAVEPRYNVMAVSVPIRDDMGALAGIVVLQSKLDNLLGWVGNIETTPNQLIYVIDQNSQVAAHPRFDPQERIVDVSGSPVAQSVLEGRHGIHIARNSGPGGGTVAAYAAIPQHDWGIVVEESYDSFFEPRNGSLNLLLAIYGVAVLFFFALFRIILEVIGRLSPPPVAGGSAPAPPGKRNR